jgi:hypothetical protein
MTKKKIRFNLPNPPHPFSHCIAFPQIRNPHSAIRNPQSPIVLCPYLIFDMQMNLNKFLIYWVFMSFLWNGTLLSAQTAPNPLQIRQLIENYETELNRYSTTGGIPKTIRQRFFLDKNNPIENDVIPESRTRVSSASVMMSPVDDYLVFFKSAGSQVHFTVLNIPTQFCLGTTDVIVSLTRTLTMRTKSPYTLPIQMRISLEKGQWGITWMGFSKDAPAVLKCGTPPAPPSPCPPLPPPTVCPPCKCESEKQLVNKWKGDFEELKQANIRLKGDYSKLKNDYADLEAIVRRVRDSVIKLERDNSTLKNILKTIREQIVATAEKAQYQKSIFAQKAAILKAEYDGFAAEEKKWRQKPANDPSKMAGLAKLEKDHTTRAVQIWQELRAVGNFHDAALVLLKDVYTWSLPNAMVPQLNNPNIPNEKLPAPQQLLKSLQTAEPACDDANFAQLDILTEYAAEVMAVTDVNSQQSDNVSTSLSFHFLSELLLSRSPNTLSAVKSKIANGLLDDVVLQGYLSEGSSELNRANGYYNEKNYLDALRIYVDYERAIRRLPNKSVQETVKYNYATILLWNLGDFSQKKGLFKGKMKSKVRERVANATHMLNELAPLNNEIGEKARISLAKYGTRNSLTN